MKIVLIEWRGLDQKSIIWQSKRGREQWLTQETIDQMGIGKFTAFEAEWIEGVWHIGRKCDALARSSAPRPTGYKILSAKQA